MNRFKTIIKTISKIFYILFLIVKAFFSFTQSVISFIRKNINFSNNSLANLSKKLKRLFRFSITFKITVAYGLIFSFLLLLSSSGILGSFYFYLIYEVRNDVFNSNEILTTYLSDSQEIPFNKFDQVASEKNIYITMFNANKQIIYSSKNNNRQLLEELLKFPTFQAELYKYHYMIYNKKLTINKQIHYLQTVKSLEKENMYIKILLFVLILFNGLIILITLLLGSKVSRKMLHPIEKMTKTVQDISIQQLDTRLDIKGSQDELKELAETFNEMLDRIQVSYIKQDQFVSDASHELRTPISVIKGYASLLDRWGKNDLAILDESLHAIKTEADNMQDLTEKLLFLAKSDKNQHKIDKESFWLDQLLDEIVKETKLIDNNHEICVNNFQEILISADKKLLKQCIRILVDNSLKFTQDNGTITLIAFKNRKNIIIEVEDNGMGIPKEDLPYIFDRFYRADKSRTKQSGGSGLGLSIAKWIVEKHHGKITAKSVLGKGTKISISLPI